MGKANWCVLAPKSDDTDQLEPLFGSRLSFRGDAIPARYAIIDVGVTPIALSEEFDLEAYAPLVGQAPVQGTGRHA